MFGGLMKKVAGGDPQKAKKANDMAEKLSGVDLDGDGTIAGVPIKKEEPKPAAPVVAQKTQAPPTQQPQQQAGGMDYSRLLEQGKAMLTQSGKVKPAAGGTGFAGMLDNFRKFTPSVQQQAEVEARKLDDGRDIPLSSLTGSKKSLLIGINYFGTANALRGCINDVNNVKALITTKFKFPTDANHMLILTDDQQDPTKKPTKANILNGMKWLVSGAKSGDSLFIHYSGHGATQKDVRPDTDEADGQDETLVPLDYQTAGMIVDDDIFDIMVAPLPKGVRLTALMDCCHSGSVFDLPYSYVFEQGRDLPVEVDNRKVAIAAALAAGKALMQKDYKGAFNQLLAAGKAYMAMQGEQQQGGGAQNSNNSNSNNSPAQPTFTTPSHSSSSAADAPYVDPMSGGNDAPYVDPMAGGNDAPYVDPMAGGNDAPYVDPMAGGNDAPYVDPMASTSAPAKTKLGSVTTSANVTQDYISVKTALCDCVQFSGCRDEQTSADAFIGGQATGAMSYALITAIEEHGLNQSYAELLKNIRGILQNKYKQVPQMSTGHRMLDLDGPFLM